MPETIRRTSYSANGWFEEDCDWALPYLALGLDAFEPEAARGPSLRAAAIRTVRAYHADHIALLGIASEAGEPGHG